MKLNGKKISERQPEVVVIPRPEGDCVFKCACVLNYDEFEELCPRPKPPTLLKPGGAQEVDIDDQKFQEELEDYARKRTHWMMLTSLQATENLEWETVNMLNPDTYGNFIKELEDASFSVMEINQITGAVLTACGLNQGKIDEARKRFLAGQAEVLKEQLSRSSELSITPSGVPAKDSESDPTE